MRGGRRTTHRAAHSVAITCLMAVTALVATVVTPPVKAAASQRRIELRGVNLIRASETSGIPVRIPTDVELTKKVVGPENWITRDIRIEGDAQLAGVVLVEQGDPLDETTRLVALEGHWREGAAGETPGFFVSHSAAVSEGRETEVVPAGDYLLYVVAERGNAAIRLRLRGLEGTRTLFPSLPAAGSLGEAEAATSVDAPAGFSAYWGGREVRLDGERGMFLSVLKVGGGLWARGRTGGCVYKDAPPPDPIAYGPRCPGGFDTAIEDGMVRTDFDNVGRYLAFVEPGGAWAFGHYYYAAANVEARRHLTFFLDLDEGALR